MLEMCIFNPPQVNDATKIRAVCHTISIKIGHGQSARILLT